MLPAGQFVKRDRNCVDDDGNGGRVFSADMGCEIGTGVSSALPYANRNDLMALLADPSTIQALSSRYVNFPSRQSGLSGVKHLSCCRMAGLDWALIFFDTGMHKEIWGLKCTLAPMLCVLHERCQPPMWGYQRTVVDAAGGVALPMAG